MVIDTCLRSFHYFCYTAKQAAWVQLNRMDEELKNPHSNSLRVALAAIFNLGSILVTCLLSWKWIVVAYTMQTLLDMYVLPRARGQRWDEIMHQGLNFGLAIRASYLTISGILSLSPLTALQGVFLGGALFFKEDWDQFNWGSYYHFPLESKFVAPNSLEISSTVSGSHALSRSTSQSGPFVELSLLPD